MPRPTPPELTTIFLCTFQSFLYAFIHIYLEPFKIFLCVSVLVVYSYATIYPKLSIKTTNIISQFLGQECREKLSRVLLAWAVSLSDSQAYWQSS